MAAPDELETELETLTALGYVADDGPDAARRRLETELGERLGFPVTIDERVPAGELRVVS